MVTCDGRVWRSIFDRFGNRTFDTTGSNTTTLPSSFNANIYNPTINPANNQFNTGQDYDYDPAGNVVEDASGKKFNYDGENKQSSFGTGGSLTNGGTYFYDGDGHRVKKVIGSEVTVFVYNSSAQLVAEHATTAPSSPQLSYLTSDDLGTPRINTNPAGAIIARHDYRPFGEEISSVGDRSSNLNYIDDSVIQKFTGKERDLESGLDYFAARYYSTLEGRFRSPDNYLNDTHADDPLSWNLYVYVRNCPLIYSDPTGEEVYDTNLSEKERNRLIADWKRETGYKDISFVDGKLTINVEAGRDGGSDKDAEQLLGAATSKSIRFELMSVDTTDIAFAQVDGGSTTQKAGSSDKVTSYNVKIDFKDFDRLTGDKEAKAAYSVGINVVHEMDHKMFNERDEPNGSSDPGPVERKYINPIRKELGLPQRVHYVGETVPRGPTNRDGNMRQLRFDQNGKQRVLKWRHDLVGGPEDK